MRLNWLLRCLVLICMYGLIFMIAATESDDDVEIKHQEAPVKKIVLEGQDHLHGEEDMHENVEGAGDRPLEEEGHNQDGFEFTDHEQSSHERGGHENDHHEHGSHENEGVGHDHDGHEDVGHDHGGHEHGSHEDVGHEHEAFEDAGHEHDAHEDGGLEHGGHDHEHASHEFQMDEHEEDVDHVPIDDDLMMDEDFHYENEADHHHHGDLHVHDLDAEQIITPQPPHEKQRKKIPDVTLINKFLFLEKLMTSGQNFLINLGALGCDKCQLFYEEYRMVLHYLHDTKQHIDAFLVTDKNLLDDFSFEMFEYPVVLYYRAGIPVIYNGELTATSLQHWVASHSHRTSTELTDDNFQHHVAANEDRTTHWLVLFCIMSDPKCWRPLAITETFATTTSMVNIGTVDISENKVLSEKMANPKQFPAWLLFRDHDTVELQFYERLTLQHMEDVYKDSALTLSEKLSRAVIQVRSVMMWTGALVTGALFLLCIICRKLARIGERNAKKGV